MVGRFGERAIGIGTWSGSQARASLRVTVRVRKAKRSEQPTHPHLTPPTHRRDCDLPFCFCFGLARSAKRWGIAPALALLPKMMLGPFAGLGEGLVYAGRVSFASAAFS